MRCILPIFNGPDAWTSTTPAHHPEASAHGPVNEAVDELILCVAALAKAGPDLALSNLRFISPWTGLASVQYDLLFEAPNGPGATKDDEISPQQRDAALREALTHANKAFTTELPSSTPENVVAQIIANSQALRGHCLRRLGRWIGAYRAYVRAAWVFRLAVSGGRRMGMEVLVDLCGNCAMRARRSEYRRKKEEEALEEEEWVDEEDSDEEDWLEEDDEEDWLDEGDDEDWLDEDEYEDEVDEDEYEDEGYEEEDQDDGASVGWVAFEDVPKSAEDEDQGETRPRADSPVILTDAWGTVVGRLEKRPALRAVKGKSFDSLVPVLGPGFTHELVPTRDGRIAPQCHPFSLSDILREVRNIQLREAQDIQALFQSAD